MTYETTGIYLVSKIHFNNSLLPPSMLNYRTFIYLSCFSISVSQPSVRAFAKTCFLTITYTMGRYD